VSFNFPTSQLIGNRDMNEKNSVTFSDANDKQFAVSANTLIIDISNLIEKAQLKVAREYNFAHVELCWLIGRRIDHEILQSKRAHYGNQIIDHISIYLTVRYGRGYSRQTLFRMIKFSKLFNDFKIVSTLSGQLSWSHFTLLCAIDDSLKRDFYVEMCRIDFWSVRTLQKQIESMLYERTAISKQPVENIRSEIAKVKQEDKLTPSMVFKDPYFLDFVGLEGHFSEADLENAILNELTKFLQELGTDFCFVARQKRMSTGKKDRYLDLLFYNRNLQRLIAIDLKLGDFDPSHKGQMEWYLKWLDKHERKSWEHHPLGIILCAGKDSEDIEYLELDNSGIHVAQYYTALPPREVLETKLRQAIITAKEAFLQKPESKKTKRAK
jgi:predicted nuclease of restriction endonuclease-like (RecB) superfamily